MSSRLLPRSRSLLRGLVALLAVCGVVLGVSACQVRSGAAAFVGDDKITEAQVGTYLVKDAKVDVDTSDPTAQTARQSAVSFLIIRQLARQYADANRVNRSDAAIQSVRTDVLGADEATTLTQARQSAAQAGLTSSFVDLRVEVVSLVQLIQKSGVPEADLGKALGQGRKVKLSPRYGTWDETALAVSASTPSYLTLSSAAAAPA